MAGAAFGSRSFPMIGSGVKYQVRFEMKQTNQIIY
jgi:hypothetical protein